MTDTFKAGIEADALEYAARHIYEVKGDRLGKNYIGWDNEPDEVKDDWRADVRAAVEAYLFRSLPLPAPATDATEIAKLRETLSGALAYIADEPGKPGLMWLSRRAREHRLRSQDRKDG